MNPGKVAAMPINVGVAGFGTVGREVVRLLQADRQQFQSRFGVDLNLSLVLDRRHRDKDTSWICEQTKFTDSVDEFLAGPCDVIVEVIGGMEPARRIIREALREGSAVVTANKLVMARCGAELLRLAAERNAYLGFEAAVAGGIPIIRLIRRCLLSDEIVRVRGILNGTCNFILSEMHDRGRDYQSALAEAQSLGYAEADPFLDVSGGDTADKLAILSSLCFNGMIDPEKIPTQGVSTIDSVDVLYARKLDCNIKLLGLAEKTSRGLSIRVSPFLIDKRLPLAKISGVLNAVEVTGATVGPVVISGQGAGGGPTAVSVVADVLNAGLWKKGSEVQDNHAGSSELARERMESDALTGLEISDRDECYPFYLRFFVEDRPGIIAELASILAREHINIDSVIQESWADSSRLPFIITVERTNISKMQVALEEMAKLDFNHIRPLMLPILKE